MHAHIVRARLRKLRLEDLLDFAVTHAEEIIGKHIVWKENGVKQLLTQWSALIVITRLFHTVIKIENTVATHIMY